MRDEILSGPKIPAWMLSGFPTSVAGSGADCEDHEDSVQVLFRERGAATSVNAGQDIGHGMER